MLNDRCKLLLDNADLKQILKKQLLFRLRVLLIKKAQFFQSNNLLEKKLFKKLSPLI